MVLPGGPRGTWRTETVVAAADVLPLRDGGDPVQQAMLGINPATAYQLRERFVDLRCASAAGMSCRSTATTWPRGSRTP